MKKPIPALEDVHVIPPKLAPEAVSGFVLSGEAEHERDHIRAYVEAEADEEVNPYRAVCRRCGWTEHEHADDR